MSVPFEQAIEELYSIFGGFDKEIIETVLRQNKGHMEKTIDALLEMNGEQPINENTDQDQNIAQIHQDEMLARMMQNQLFLNELKNDEDFSGFFNNKTNNGVYKSNNSNNESNNSSSIGGSISNRNLTPKEELEQYQREKAQKQQLYDDEPSALSVFEEDFQEIKVKFNQLGEVAKNKFRELTEMFNKKEETKYESVRTGDEINSSDNNNNNEEDDDDDEEEVVVYDRYNNSRNKSSGGFNSGGFNNTRHINTGINTNYSLNGDEESEEEYDSFILESDRSRNTSTSRMRTTVNSYSNHKKQD